MDIDKLDFTPYWVGFKIGLFLSEDECAFFNTTWEHMMSWSDPSPAKDYAKKLATYHGRFDNHMPIPIRKELLRDMVSGAGT